jgi:hypothetical protein
MSGRFSLASVAREKRPFARKKRRRKSKGSSTFICHEVVTSSGFFRPVWGLKKRKRGVGVRFWIADFGLEEEEKTEARGFAHTEEESLRDGDFIHRPEAYATLKRRVTIKDGCATLREEGRNMLCPYKTKNGRTGCHFPTRGESALVKVCEAGYDASRHASVKGACPLLRLGMDYGRNGRQK